MVCPSQCPESVRAVQNEAHQRHQSHNQSQNDDDAQSVRFRFLPVVDRNDGVQQMVDVAAMNLVYVKLHACGLSTNQASA